MKLFILVSALFLAFATAANAQSSDSKQTAPPQAQSQQGWVQMNSGTTDPLVRLSYGSKDTAFVNSFSPFRTIDGGLTWQHFSIPISGIVSFYGSQIGYVADVQNGNNIGDYTHDAGQHWFSMNDSNQLVKQIYPITADTAFMVGSGVTRTTDGGKTWGSATYGGWAGLLAASFYDSQHGIVVGQLQSGPLPQHPEETAGCFTTSDGGRTWVQQYTGIYSSLLSATYVGRQIIVATGAPSYFVRSRDEGIHWDSVAFPGEYSQIAFKSGRLIAVGGAGAIATSLDSGKTWAFEPSGVNSILSSVAMYSDSLALACGEGGVILRTTNGGTQWVQVAPPSNSTLTTQSYPEPSHGSLQLSYTLPQLQDVTVTVTDVTGRVVATPTVRQLQPAGQHTVPFDGRALPVGAYTYTIQTERFFGSGKFTIVR